MLLLPPFPQHQHATVPPSPFSTIHTSRDYLEWSWIGPARAGPFWCHVTPKWSTPSYEEVAQLPLTRAITLIFIGKCSHGQSCDVALFGTAYISKSVVNHKSFPTFSFLSRLLILLLLHNFRIFGYLLLPSLLLLPPLNNFRIFGYLLLIFALLSICSFPPPPPPTQYFRIFGHLLLPSLLLLLPPLNNFRTFGYLLLILYFGLL
ncbi:hypothetical protein C8R48DRAFT_778675 [Suillus tomentosus]|nr:hypothetical protein C8R48DRAFT_778675 [Suillus tomentosus]